MGIYLDDDIGRLIFLIFYINIRIFDENIVDTRDYFPLIIITVLWTTTHLRHPIFTTQITIMVDKFTCQPKGFAYMEFADEQNVNNAVLLNDSLFRGRQLKVCGLNGDF